MLDDRPAQVSGVILGMRNDVKGGGGNVLTAGACCGLCRAAAGCVAWTWHPNATTMATADAVAALKPKNSALKCFLHGAIGPTERHAGVISGVPAGTMPPLPPPTPPGPPPSPGGGVGHPSGPDACTPGTPGTRFPFCNASKTVSARVADLVSRVEVSELGGQMTARQNPAIDRLGVPSYYWGTNAIHGMQDVACLPTGQCPTSFPAPCSLAASFNMSLVKDMGNVIGRELRAYYNGKVHNGTSLSS